MTVSMTEGRAASGTRTGTVEQPTKHNKDKIYFMIYFLLLRFQSRSLLGIPRFDDSQMYKETHSPQQKPYGCIGE